MDAYPTGDVTIPTDRELAVKYGPYLLDPSLPEPSADDAAFRLIRNPETLRAELLKARDQYDNAVAERKRIADWSAGLKAEREAKAAAEQKVRDDAQAARLREERAALEADLKRKYLTNPAATEADWDADKDTIVREHLRITMGVADERARQLSAAQLRRVF